MTDSYHIANAKVAHKCHRFITAEEVEVEKVDANLELATVATNNLGKAFQLDPFTTYSLREEYHPK